MGNSFCSGPVDGEPEGNRSTRAELFAIASVLRFFAELIKYHAVNTSRTLYIWSDSAVAIKQVQVIKEGISRGRPPLNADIASIIQELVGSTPIEMNVDWLRSHQHPSRDIDGLLLSAKLNVRADALAEQYLLMHPRGQTGYPHLNTPNFPQMRASVLIGNTRIHSETS